jgi:hypothetical protein
VAQASKMRRSMRQGRYYSSTPLDSKQRLKILAEILSGTSSLGKASSETELFLRYSAAFSEVEARINMSEVLPSVFAQRLGLVVNTGYQTVLSNDNEVFYGDNTTNLSSYGFDFRLTARWPSHVVDETCKLMCTQSTRAVLTTSVEVFSYSRFWLAVLFASSTVLLATGLAGSILSWRTSAPNVLGYVASTAYNNNSLDVPGGGGVLDATDRAPMLCDLHVSIGDVNGNEVTEHIAFTSHACTRKLEDGRLYTTDCAPRRHFAEQHAPNQNFNFCLFSLIGINHSHYSFDAGQSYQIDGLFSILYNEEQCKR